MNMENSDNNAVEAEYTPPQVRNSFAKTEGVHYQFLPSDAVHITSNIP